MRVLKKTFTNYHRQMRGFLCNAHYNTSKRENASRNLRRVKNACSGIFKTRYEYGHRVSPPGTGTVPVQSSGVRSYLLIHSTFPYEIEWRAPSCPNTNIICTSKIIIIMIICIHVISVCSYFPYTYNFI